MDMGHETSGMGHGIWNMGSWDKGYRIEDK